MDWLTFISKIIDSIAWPGAVILIALIFRNEIGKLLRLIRKLRHGDLEVTFGEELEKAREESEELGSPIDTPAEIIRDQELLNLAKNHPPAAVIEAWKDIEKELIQLGRRKNQLQINRPHQVFSQMRNDNEIGPTAGKLYQRLRSLRNKAVHQSDFKLTEGQALEYVELASNMAWFFRALKNGE